MTSDDPTAFFLTWVTYGTWLPGDARGWVEYREGWKSLLEPLGRDCELRMNEDEVTLSLTQRTTVERQIAETCRYREWTLHAVNCRTNHVHVVVSAPETSLKKIRSDLKAYTVRALKPFEPRRSKWWAERGSVRWVQRDCDLEAVTSYVTDGQDRKYDVEL